MGAENFIPPTPLPVLVQFPVLAMVITRFPSIGSSLANFRTWKNVALRFKLRDKARSRP